MKIPRKEIISPILKSKFFDEGGFSLVSVLLMLGIISISIIGFSRYISSSRTAKARLKSNQSAGDVETILQTIISQKAQNFFEQSCKKKVTLTDTPIGSSVKVGSFNNLNNFPSQANSTQTAARDRCLQGTSRRPKSASSQDASGVHFCFKFDFPSDQVKSKLSQSSFGRNDWGFVEVYARNLTTDTLTPVKCSTIASKKYPPNTGMDIYYTLYWIRKLKSKYIQKTRNSHFFVTLPRN